MTLTRLERITTAGKHMLTINHSKGKDKHLDIKLSNVLHAEGKVEQLTLGDTIKGSTFKRNQWEERRSWKDKKRKPEENWALRNIELLKY